MEATPDSKVPVNRARVLVGYEGHLIAMARFEAARMFLTGGFASRPRSDSP